MANVKVHKLEWLNPYADDPDYTSPTYPYNFQCLNCGKRFLNKLSGESEQCYG